MCPTNLYETAEQKVIPATLIYAFYQDSILMIHRNRKANDIHEGKWNGVGGKLEKGETAAEAATREFKEEVFCDIPVSQWKWMGQLYFPNFKATKNEDWWVNVFVTELNEEQAKSIPTEKTLPEGTLHFVPISKIMDLNLWDGDQHFIPYILRMSPFNGTFFYENGSCVRYEISEIK